MPMRYQQDDDAPMTLVTKKKLMTSILALWSYVGLALWEKLLGGGIRLSADRRGQTRFMFTNESSLMRLDCL